MKNSDDGPAGWFSNLLRVLAKLGILRYGVKSATYTSGRDRPAELLMPNVFNADRDLTTAQDIKALLGRSGPPEKPSNVKAVPMPAPQAAHDIFRRRK
jgi:hypothetical protein